jgi:hypothetical protein
MATYELTVKTMGVTEEEAVRRTMITIIRFLALNLPHRYPPIKGVKELRKTLQIEADF